MARLQSIMRRQKLSREDLLTMLRRMAEIRAFEEKVYDLLGRNVIKGASHLYAGEEAVAVGALAAVGPDDIITSTHRGHGHCHAHGDRHAATSEAKQEHLNRMMAELCGRSTGYCKGRLFASPRARRAAQEKGVDLALVEGSGPERPHRRGRRGLRGG